jgi:hypothetical protein
VFAALGGRGPERLSDLGIRIGPWVGLRAGGLTLDIVRSHPDGRRPAELDGGRLDETVTTPSGKVELVHPILTADIPRLLAAQRTGPDARSGPPARCSSIPTTPRGSSWSTASLPRFRRQRVRVSR